MKTITYQFTVGDLVHDWNLHNIGGIVTEVTENKIEVQFHRDFLVRYKKSEFKHLSKNCN